MPKAKSSKQKPSTPKPKKPSRKVDFPKSSPVVDEAFLKFATKADRDKILNSSDAKAVVKAVEATRKRAVIQGWSPEHGWKNPVPTPHVARGVSTLYDADGVVRQTWVKSRLDDELYQQALKEASEAILEPLVGLSKPPVDPKVTDDDLINVYVVGDMHVGMLAWARETLGENYNLQVAENIHVKATQMLCSKAPKSSRALVIILGDTTHSDNFDFLTQSGHRLDADSRYPKMVRTATRTLRAMAECALGYHSEVTWWNVPGNHDKNSRPWIDEVLKAYYHNVDRFMINDSPAKHLYGQFGQNMIAATHGDTIKGKFNKRSPYSAQDFASVMAIDAPGIWGSTKFRHGFQGHIHSENSVEAGGIILRSVRVLGPNDAWHAAQLYRSGRSMMRMTFHKDFGHVGTEHVPVEMVL